MLDLMVTEQSPQLFGGAHLGLLGIAALVGVLAVWFVRSIRTTATQNMVIRTAGWVLLAIAVAQTVWTVLPGNWNIHSSLPLHYSDLLRFITAIALIWRLRWAVAVSYYWGLTLNLQAIITPHPSMLSGPSVGFLFYWVLHILVFVAPLVLIWGVGFRPQWKDFTLTYGLAIGWAIVVMPINEWLGTNYGFVNHPPDGESVIDWLGPWPIYVVFMALIAGVLWALMTWPWVRQQRD